MIKSREAVQTSLQLLNVLESSNILEKFHLGFRAQHAEWALFKVSDTLVSLNYGNGVVWHLLDFITAFDTVDHQILLNHLPHYIGVLGTVPQWFTSYLCNKTYSVKIRDFSFMAPVTNRISQGLLLGPILFSYYMLSLGYNFHKYNISSNFYSDYTQIYMPFNLEDPKPTKVLHNCFQAVKS